MLSHLHIQKFALIDKMDIDFSSSLNILTGETGAGKSIVIDAIRFVLGERLDSIRFDGEQGSSIVEASFELSPFLLKQEQIAAYLGSEDQVLILRREYQGQGKTKCWINERVVNVSTLKTIGSYLIDIHGQYDHQKLLDPDWQLELLDQFAKLSQDKKEYKKLFTEYADLARRKEELINLSEGRDREIDLLKYQIDEIERAEIDDLSEEEIEKERLKLANAEKLSELSNHILESLDEERSVTALLARVQKDLSSLTRLDGDIEHLKAQVDDILISAEEMARFFRGYQESLSFEPERLAELERKSDYLTLLKKKYGKSLADIKTFLEQSKQKYDQLINSEVFVQEVEKKIRELTPAITQCAAGITKKRSKAAQTIKLEIEQELKDLNMPYAVFECLFSKNDFCESGVDSVEFNLLVNLGHSLQPLREIVSAGEIARIMLALKKTLAKVDQVPTLIFDEIDANIGGRLGQVTGKKLSEISANHQVLLITHLPQIASFANRHFKVSKLTRSGKTVAAYQLLEGDDRVKELSQMMTGHQETEISRKHAEEMLTRSSSGKGIS